MDISAFAAKAIGAKRNDRSGGVVMGGSGMNYCFALVYALGKALWPNGTAVPHGKRNGQPDTDGGYALQYRDL
jgi:hypothetical protein